MGLGCLTTWIKPGNACSDPTRTVASAGKTKVGSIWKLHLPHQMKTGRQSRERLRGLDDDERCRPVCFGGGVFLLGEMSLLIFLGGSAIKSNFKSLNILALEKKKRWHFEDKEPCITRYSTVGFVTTKVRIQSNASSLPRQSNLAVLDRISPEKTEPEEMETNYPQVHLPVFKELRVWWKHLKIQKYPARCGPQINLNYWNCPN